MSLKLDGHPCKLGTAVNTRREKHGDDNVPAKDLKLVNVMLSKSELNALLDDKHAWDAFFVEKKGKPAMPLFKGKIGAIPKLGTYKQSRATLSFGLRPYSVEFIECTLKSIKLEPQEGGLMAMTLMLQCLKANIRGDLERIDEHLDTEVNVSLEFGDPEDDDAGDEDELNLDHSKSAASAKPKTNGSARKPKASDSATVN